MSRHPTSGLCRMKSTEKIAATLRLQRIKKSRSTSKSDGPVIDYAGSIAAYLRRLQLGSVEPERLEPRQRKIVFYCAFCSEVRYEIDAIPPEFNARGTRFGEVAERYRSRIAAHAWNKHAVLGRRARAGGGITLLDVW